LKENKTPSIERPKKHTKFSPLSPGLLKTKFSIDKKIAQKIKCSKDAHDVGTYSLFTYFWNLGYSLFSVILILELTCGSYTQLPPHQGFPMDGGSGECWVTLVHKRRDLKKYYMGLQYKKCLQSVSLLSVHLIFKNISDSSVLLE
jgi:hypothetical protein